MVLKAIVGHEAAKFTPETEAKAKAKIREILTADDELVSGGCHLGGIDIWAEEIADELGIPKHIKYPERRCWSGGYKERNLEIVDDCEELHNIVVKEYHSDYKGMRFDYCYHCDSKGHVKSGGCWTMNKAAAKDKNAVIHIVD